MPDFDLSKVNKMTINFEPLKASKITSLKISSSGEARKYLKIVNNL